MLPSALHLLQVQGFFGLPQHERLDAQRQARRCSTEVLRGGVAAMLLLANRLVHRLLEVHDCGRLLRQRAASAPQMVQPLRWRYLFHPSKVAHGFCPATQSSAVPRGHRAHPGNRACSAQNFAGPAASRRRGRRCRGLQPASLWRCAWRSRGRGLARAQRHSEWWAQAVGGPARARLGGEARRALRWHAGSAEEIGRLLCDAGAPGRALEPGPRGVGQGQAEALPRHRHSSDLVGASWVRLGLCRRCCGSLLQLEVDLRASPRLRSAAPKREHRGGADRHRARGVLR
mmetsp:Transcript_39921/g.127961  ORF Transcript_39921/g.127961 Transcript_39921/m.127961 type:complete len:287 (+) Transcript_39921:1364-2224(+)